MLLNLTSAPTSVKQTPPPRHVTAKRLPTSLRWKPKSTPPPFSIGAHCCKVRFCCSNTTFAESKLREEHSLALRTYADRCCKKLLTLSGWEPKNTCCGAMGAAGSWKWLALIGAAAALMSLAWS